MNFIYLLGNLSLSRWDNNEIRYSLRSIEQAFSVDWVGIAGPEMPSFLTGIEHIKSNPTGAKFKNQQRQLVAACLSDRVPDTLILMNDDFIVRSAPPWSWTSTHLGPIIEKKKMNSWRRSIFATGEWCKDQGVLNPLNYEGHTPFSFSKSAMLPLLEKIVHSEQPLQLRTAYGNFLRIGGSQHPNAKRKDQTTWPAESPFWSLKGDVSDKAKIFLEGWLSKPSRWEK